MNFLDFIFPKKCLECKANGRYLCVNCIKNSKKNLDTCVECNRASFQGITHPKCRKKYGLDGLTSVWKYDGVIRKAILSLKFKFASDLVSELSEHIAQEIRNRSFYNNPVLVPIPLHIKRQKWRGFNQAEEIGEMVAKIMGWKYAKDLLIKKLATKPQTRLEKSERIKNIKGVFALNTHYNFDNTQKVILFDDVYTTGSTLREASKVLKMGGVKEVWGLTVSR